MTVTSADHLTVLQLLRAGYGDSEASRRTGWSRWTVRRLREQHEIPAGLPGRPRAPEVMVEDVIEEDGRSSKASPWIPPRGYDPAAERPHQRRWLALLAAARPGEMKRLRNAVTSVLGLSVYASGDTIVLALIADRRTADELARLYLEAAS